MEQLIHLYNWLDEQRYVVFWIITAVVCITTSILALKDILPVFNIVFMTIYMTCQLIVTLNGEDVSFIKTIMMKISISLFISTLIMYTYPGT